MKLILTLVAFLAFLCGQSLAADRPNIILMMGDDHGWEETGYNGHPHVKTPVLDEMARTGLRLDRFYAAHPSCSPTRASFLTGRHPNRMAPSRPAGHFARRKSPPHICSARRAITAGTLANGTSAR